MFCDKLWEDREEITRVWIPFLGKIGKEIKDGHQMLEVIIRTTVLLHDRMSVEMEEIMEEVCEGGDTV